MSWLSRRRASPQPHWADEPELARPRHGQTANRGAVIRWPAVILLGGAIVAMSTTGKTPEEAGTGDSPAAARTVAAAVGDPESLASSWYCAAGTTIDGGFGDHTVILSNGSAHEATVQLSVVPVVAPQPLDPSTSDNVDPDEEPVEDESPAPSVTADNIGRAPDPVVLDTVRETVTVAPSTVQRVRLGELDGVSGEYAAALVESDLGDLLVEHELRGPAGTDTAPCSTTSSDHWYLAGGTSRSGARQFVVIYNPFPGSAVVDMTFSADGTVREPQAYQGLVVPSGAVLPVEISRVVTLSDIVSTAIDVRSGRVIVDRVVLFDPAEGAPAGGLSVSPGAPASATEWVVPAGLGLDGPAALVVYNPDAEASALVDIELHYGAGSDTVVEPVQVTVRPHRTEVITLGPGADKITSGRLADASGRVDDDSYWLVVRSLDGNPVVVDRLTMGSPDRAAAVSRAIPVAATVHAFTTGSGQGAVAIAQPADDRIAIADIRVHSDGKIFTVANSPELAEGSRTILDFAASGFPAGALVIIETNEPVYVERLVDAGGGAIWQPAVPLGPTTIRPIIAFG